MYFARGFVQRASLMNSVVKKYLAVIGARGGRKSRRVLTSEQARRMVQARERKRRNGKKKTE